VRLEEYCTLNGAGITVQDWTPKYLTFYSQQLGGNIEFAAAGTGSQNIRSPDHSFNAGRPCLPITVSSPSAQADPERPALGEAIRSCRSQPGQVAGVTDSGTGPVFYNAREGTLLPFS
jgi:hypothetical protein